MATVNCPSCKNAFDPKHYIVKAGAFAAGAGAGALLGSGVGLVAGPSVGLPAPSPVRPSAAYSPCWA